MSLHLLDRIKGEVISICNQNQSFFYGLHLRQKCSRHPNSGEILRGWKLEAWVPTSVPVLIWVWVWVPLHGAEWNLGLGWGTWISWTRTPLPNAQTLFKIMQCQLMLFISIQYNNIQRFPLRAVPLRTIWGLIRLYSGRFEYPGLHQWSTVKESACSSS